MATCSSLPTSTIPTQSSSDGDLTDLVHDTTRQFSDVFKEASFATQYKGIEYLMFVYASKMLKMMFLTSCLPSKPLHYLDQACGTGVCLRAALDILSES